MIIRRAHRSDVPSIVSIYGLDKLIGDQEMMSDPLPEFYFSAFDCIDADPNQLLLVAEDESEIAGTLQMTIVQHLLSRALRRAVIEAFFVHPDYQGKGVGTALLEQAINIARNSHCTAVELTSNKARNRAHMFYSKMGFHATHEGFKLALNKNDRSDTPDPQ